MDTIELIKDTCLHGGAVPTERAQEVRGFLESLSGNSESIVKGSKPLEGEDLKNTNEFFRQAEHPVLKRGNSEKETFIEYFQVIAGENMYKHVDDFDYSQGMESMSSEEIKEAAIEMYDALKSEVKKELPTDEEIDRKFNYHPESELLYSYEMHMKNVGAKDLRDLIFCNTDFSQPETVEAKEQEKGFYCNDFTALSMPLKCDIECAKCKNGEY